MHKRRRSKLNRAKQISYPAVMPYWKNGFVDALNGCHGLCFYFLWIIFTRSDKVRDFLLRLKDSASADEDDETSALGAANQDPFAI